MRSHRFVLGENDKKWKPKKRIRLWERQLDGISREHPGRGPDFRRDKYGLQEEG